MTPDEFCQRYSSGHIKVEMYDVDRAIMDLISAYKTAIAQLDKERVEIEKLKEIISDLRPRLARTRKVVRAAKACVNSRHWQGVCDEDVLLEELIRELEEP